MTARKNKVIVHPADYYAVGTKSLCGEIRLCQFGRFGSNQQAGTTGGGGAHYFKFRTCYLLEKLGQFCCCVLFGLPCVLGYNDNSFCYPVFRYQC
jgi:hypothetical protein